MYIEEVEKILDELGGYLKIVGVKTGVKTIPYRLHGDYFIRIANANKRQLKQAGTLMSNDRHAFHLALAQRLEHFAGEMGGEYAERATDVINKLAELDNLHASKQHEKEADLENLAAKAGRMYDTFAMHTLREVGDYLESVGIRAGVTAPPGEPHNQFIAIIDMNKSRLEQAANLMSEDSNTFALVATKRLKDFAGGMDGEYAEYAADIIAALAKLNEPHASKQRKKKVVEPKSAAAKVDNHLKVFKIFNRVSFNPTNFGGWRGL